MWKSCALAVIPFLAACVFTLFLNIAFAIIRQPREAFGDLLPPLPPNTSKGGLNDASVEAIQVLIENAQQDYYDYPTRISIPSIRLDAPIEYMGVNKKGEIDVPSGKTKNVGWYKSGAIPGEIGSAVMDAHVYAAFSKLKYVLPGSDVYVETKSGARLHFVTYESTVYPLATMPLDSLIRDTKTADLNLITCAGKYVRARDTYDHRLVVYTRLVGVE